MKGFIQGFKEDYDKKLRDFIIEMRFKKISDSIILDGVLSILK